MASVPNAVPLPQKRFHVTMRRSPHLRLRALDPTIGAMPLLLEPVSERAKSNPPYRIVMPLVSFSARPRELPKDKGKDDMFPSAAGPQLQAKDAAAGTPIQEVNAESGVFELGAEMQDNGPGDASPGPKGADLSARL